jgi:hypothetical protein
VEIDGEFTKVLLRAQTGNRTVGAAIQAKSGGTLPFLPPLQYDEKKFIRNARKGEEEEGKRYWTNEAFKFGKRLAATLVALADALATSSKITPAPVWSLTSEYRMARESKIEASITACTAEIAKLQKAKVELERELDAAGNLRHLLFEQGKPLESVILDVMKLFGFEAQPFADGESEFDGLFSSSEGRCLGEIEGKDNKPINIDKFSQLERNLNEDFEREEVTEHAKGLLFGNAFRLKPVAERGDFFTDKCVSAAKRIGAALIRTPDLFHPAKYLRENPGDKEYAKKCRESIFSTVGSIVDFPKVPTAETITSPEILQSELPSTAAANIEPEK